MASNITAVQIENIEHGDYSYDDVSKDNSVNYIHMLSEAKQATNVEHEMTTWQALKIYKKACFWSIMFSLTIIMDGYDMAFVGSLFALPAFTRDFGVPYNGGYQITAAWQTGLGNAGVIFMMFGVFLDGYLSEWVGRKKVTIGALTMITGAIFCQFFATSLPVLLVGRMLTCLPIGVFAASTNTYAAEVCPVVLRAYLTTYFVAAGITYRASLITSKWAYKVIFAAQRGWPVPLICIIAFAPESPWWLVRKGRYAEAERSIRRLTDGSVNAKETVAMIIHTTQLEVELETGSSYLACVKGADLRRTEIACFVYAIQSLVGNPLQSMTTYSFEQAGLSTNAAFKMNLGNNAISIVGTMCAWPLLYFFGRRTVFFGGLFMMTILYFAIGFAAIPPITNTSANWAKSSLLIVYLFVYSPTVGATVYAIVGEVGASKLRGKTVSLARGFACFVSIIMGTLTPYMLNPTAWGWSAKAAFFFGGLAILCLIWVYFRLPEMKGRTYEEIDILFEKRLPARQFRGHKVDAYG